MPAHRPDRPLHRRDRSGGHHPHLPVRAWPTTRQPLRVVVDGLARTPLSARILDDAARTLVAVGDNADPERVKGLRDTGAEVLELPRREGGIDLGALLAALF